MKKKMAALFCAAAVVLSLLVIPSSANSSLFFLAVNDQVVSLSSQTMPVKSGGWIYVPVSVFSSRTTNVNLGVFYGFSENKDSLTFYNLSGKTMTFNLADGTATTDSGESPMPSRILRQNGIYYAPAYTICQHFGLVYSYYTTDYGPLLRIKNGNAVLNDSGFLSAANGALRSQYNSVHQNNTTPGSGQTSVTPAPSPVNPDMSNQETQKKGPKLSVHVGLKVTAATDVSGALNALGKARASAVAFFPVDDLMNLRDQLRQAAGSGCQIGLIPKGDTAQAQLESVQKGSALVAKILHQEVWFVLGNEEKLANAGYVCWSPQMTPDTWGTAVQMYDSIVKFGSGHSNSGRVLLSSQTPTAVLSEMLGRLTNDGDTFLMSRETGF